MICATAGTGSRLSEFASRQERRMSEKPTEPDPLRFLIGLGAFGLRRIVFGGGATALA